MGKTPRPRPKAVVTLPRYRQRNDAGMEDPPVVSIFTEIGRGVAGCCFCDSPIPKEVTRFVIDVLLRTPATTKTGKSRPKERYYGHSGCLAGLMGNEVLLTGRTCWDCGAPPPSPRTRNEGDEEDLPDPWTWNGRHPFSVFTTSKFAAARLCGDCFRKPKWGQCQGCHVVFPHWMVSEVVDDLEAKAAEAAKKAAFFDADPAFIISPYTPGVVMVCPTCATRAGVRTRATVEAEKAEFDELRKRIIDEGMFGEDE